MLAELLCTACSRAYATQRLPMNHPCLFHTHTRGDTDSNETTTAPDHALQPHISGLLQCKPTPAATIFDTQSEHRSQHPHTCTHIHTTLFSRLTQRRFCLSPCLFTTAHSHTRTHTVEWEAPDLGSKDKERVPFSCRKFLFAPTSRQLRIRSLQACMHGSMLTYIM
jgi:hypothetical protein